MSDLQYISWDDWLGDVDEAAWRRLLEKRGGCSCHISPPCSSCCDPVSEDELNSVGYTYERKDTQMNTTNTTHEPVSNELPPIEQSDIEKDNFMTWASEAGYDTAYTYDTERSRWLFLNPMTADLWDAWKARAAIAAKPLSFEDSVTEAKVCCGEYATCHRACTPRGRWQANRDHDALAAKPEPVSGERGELIAQLREAEEALPMEGGRYCDRVAKLCGQAAAMLAADAKRVEARPLTEEEIAKTMTDFGYTGIPFATVVRMFRLCEAAHGIKEKS